MSLGLVAASKLAYTMNYISISTLYRVEVLLRDFGLPTKIKGISHEQLLFHMQFDKKRRKGKLRFVLPIGLGSVRVIDTVDETLLKSVMDTYV